jgi:hypothetical protein
MKSASATLLRVLVIAREEIFWRIMAKMVITRILKGDPRNQSIASLRLTFSSI